MKNNIIKDIIEKNRVIPIIDNSLKYIPDLIMVDFGCGKNKKNGFYGIDIFSHENIDLTLEKDWKKIKLPDNSVSAIRAIHSIEHVEDSINLWNEFYRICINGALIYAVVPYPFTPYYFQDPTHKSFYTEKTFNKYFDGEYVNSYSDYGFKGKMKSIITLIYGLDFMHLSIHALMEVMK